MFPMRRRRWTVAVLLVVVLLVAAVLFLALLPCCAPPLTPTPMGAGEFMFMSNRDGDWDIYLMTLPERSVQNLTNNDVDDGFGAFSTDGEAITFLSNRVPEEGLTAYMMNSDGANVSRVQNDLPTILNVLSTGRMTWDMTTDRLTIPITVFVSLRDLNLEVYLQTQNEVGETSERNLSSNSAIDWYPALSPDGTRIAFSSDRDGNQEIYLMNVDGMGVRRLTYQPGDDLFPAWVGGAEQIVFYSERDTTLANGTLALYMLDVDAENPIPVRLEGALFRDGNIPIGVDAHYDRERQRLFMVNVDGDWEIHLSDQVGRHEVNLTDNDSDDIFPTWR